MHRSKVVLDRLSVVVRSAVTASAMIGRGMGRGRIYALLDFRAAWAMSR